MSLLGRHGRGAIVRGRERGLGTCRSGGGSDGSGGSGRKSRRRGRCGRAEVGCRGAFARHARGGGGEDICVAARQWIAERRERNGVEKGRPWRTKNRG